MAFQYKVPEGHLLQLILQVLQQTRARLIISGASCAELNEMQAAVMQVLAYCIKAVLLDVLQGEPC
jgi:hypothetical protein